MKNMFKKIIVCLTISTFLINSPAYSFSIDNDALRSKASARAQIGKIIAERLVANNKSSSGGQPTEYTVELSDISKIFSRFIYEKDPDTLKGLISTAENQRTLVNKLKELETRWQQAFERLTSKANKIKHPYSPSEDGLLRFRLNAYTALLTALRQDIEELTSTLDQISMGCLKPESNLDAEGGFVFREWRENPDTLASGRYAHIKKIPYKSTTKDVVRFNAKLREVRKRLLAAESSPGKSLFQREDFNVGVEIVYLAYKAATYVKSRDTIILDRRCLENDDFLYFKIKHELTDRRLPEMDIIGEQFKKLPGLRELFTLITVDIAGFMRLRDNYPRRAEVMLKYCRGVGHNKRGLLRCYEKIMKNPSLNDPFNFTEDIFRLVESEEHKAYFLNMRKAVRKIASKNSDGSIDYEMTSARLRPWLKSINRQFFELQNIRNGSQFKPLTDFNKKIPVSLKPFMPYAEDIKYELDNDCIFLRIKLDNKQGQIKFAYLYIGLNDNWDAVLGKRGKIYNLTYHKWQQESADIFQYRHDGIEKERGLYWNYIIRLPITKLISKLYDKSSQGNLKKLCLNLFSELGFKDGLNNKTWLLVENIIRGKKVPPKSYYVIRGIIWKHIDRIYPKLFLGRNNLRDTSIGDIPAWLIMEDPEMSSRLLLFLNPRKKRGPTSFYEKTDKVSMRDILKMLQWTAHKRADSFRPMRQMSLFDVTPKASEIYYMQNIKSAIYLAA